MPSRRFVPIAALARCSALCASLMCASAAPLVRAADPQAPPIDDLVTRPMWPEDSRRAIVVRPGFTVELVAHEPLVVDPVAFAWDAQARLWVVEMNDYPLGLDGQGKPGGRVKILTDDDGDGRYDRATLFLDGLQYPTSVLPWRDGALVCAVPEIIFARDTDGDGRADERRPLYTGLHVGNPQHLANGLRFGPDGWVHCANGATKTAVTSVADGQSVDVGTRDFRILHDIGQIEPLAGRSQYLRECDDFGNWFGNANSNPLYHFPLDERYLRRNPHASYPLLQHDVSETPGTAQVFPVSRTVARFNDLSRANRFTSACSATIYRDELLGLEFYGNSFVCEPVHNLVHREILKPHGATFTSRKPDDEARTEFLASRDNWFRPAMVRTGPDGALWIADMYRLVIEHPEWIPKDWQAKLDLRAGSDRGRIYRVYPSQLKPWPIPKLADLEPAELVAKLETTNGTVRDLVLQLIVERYARQETRTPEIARVADALNSHFRESPRAATRFAALSALALVDEIDTLVLRAALKDAHPGVRRRALQLIDAELIKLDDKLLTAVLASADDADSAVRLQAVCTLGDVEHPAAVQNIAKLIVRDTADPFLSAAAMSSLTAEKLRYFAIVSVDEARLADTPLASSLVAAVADSAIGWKRVDALEPLMKSAIESDDAIQARATTVALFDAAARRNTSLARLSKDAGPRFAEFAAKLNDLVAAARNQVADASAAESERISALALVGRDPDAQAADVALIGRLLTPRSSDPLQTAAVAALARIDEPSAAEQLLAAWSGLAPARKAQVLDACLVRRTSTEELLKAVADRRIAAGEIDVARAQQLLNHSDKRLRETAAQVLSASVNTDRRRVVDEYQSVLALAGDAARGREAFTKSCGNCHKLGDVGHPVGPDLAALSDRRAQSLLVSVLDPNRAVESKYLAYTAETADGLTFTGLLASEGTNDLTLALADGRKQTIRRGDLESLASTAKSFMPEGLEKDLPPQKLADVLAFVAATRPTRKTFAGNTPQPVKPEALRGEFYLLPEHAEIFGPSLVFEPKFSNLGFWRSGADRAEWELEVAQAGPYDVWVEYALPPDAGGEFVVETADARLRGRSADTGSWERYRTVSLGAMTLAAGKQRLVIRPDGEPRNALFDLKSVRIKPRP